MFKFLSIDKYYNKNIVIEFFFYVIEAKANNSTRIFDDSAIFGKWSTVQHDIYGKRILARATPLSDELLLSNLWKLMVMNSKKLKILLRYVL